MNYQFFLFELEEVLFIVFEVVVELFYDEVIEIFVVFFGGKDSVVMVLYLFDLGIFKEWIILYYYEVDGCGEYLFDWLCMFSYCKVFVVVFELLLVFFWCEGGILCEMYWINEGLQDVCYEQQDGSVVVLASCFGSFICWKFFVVAVDLCIWWCSLVAKIDVLFRVIVYSYLEGGQFIICIGEWWEESLGWVIYKVYEKYWVNIKKRIVIQWCFVIDFWGK